MLKVVFRSANRSEAELVRARLEGAGFHPSVGGASQHSSLMPMVLDMDVLQIEVGVPHNEGADAEKFLLDSRIHLEGTASTGDVAAGSICPVHEQPAVAACERCGTFLCASCGSLGSPPLCEDCLIRPEKHRARPRWVTLVARVWFVVWFGSLLLGGAAALFSLFSR